MRQFQKHGLKTLRVLAIPALIAVVAGLSGCHWFNRGNPYNLSAQTRPLEVPPDLDKPDTSGAMDAPVDTTQSVLRSAVGASAQPTQDNATGFTVAGDRDDLFNKVGTALAATEGVTIASKAQLLGTYDVSYQGANFLVRVTKVDSGVYVSAVDPRGMPASSGPATALIAALKTALGG